MSDPARPNTSNPTRRTVMTGALALAAVAAASEVAEAKPPTPTPGQFRTADAIDRTRFVDEFPGATDDEKLTEAMRWQQQQTGQPALRMLPRAYNFNQPRQLYSGLKLLGSPAGPRNVEIADTAHVPTRCFLGNNIGSGTSSWWNGTGNLFDVYMADFGVQGDQGSSRQQFMDVPVNAGTLYACQFQALSFDFMRSVFGRKDRVCAFTQVVLSGHWTVNNLWDTQFNLGGSDNSLWMGGYVNIGTSQSPVQTGSYADNDYMIILSSLSKTDLGYVYCTALNGWRGIKVTGSSHGGLNFFGGVYEGFNGTSLRAPGTVIRLEGGNGTFHGPRIGQAMAAPDPAEKGYVQVSGGQWRFVGPTFFRGDTPADVPAIYQTGGSLTVLGATVANDEDWPVAPILLTTGGSAMVLDGSMSDGSTSGTNQPPTASFTTSVSGLNLTVDGSASSDPAGSISSYAWTFGDGGTATGATPATHTYAAGGTYTVTLTVTDNDNATNAATRQVTVANALATDAFNRNVTTGWGSADVGGPWTVTVSDSLSVHGGAGNMRMAAGSGPSAYLNGVSAADVDMVSKLNYDKPATATIYTSMVARRVGTSDYRLKLRSTASQTNLELVRTVNGSETVLATQVVPGFVMSASDEINVRLQVTGTGTPTVKGKIWLTGNAEPANWALTATDTSTAALQNPGAVGFYSYLSGSATNAPITLQVQDFLVQAP